MATAITLDITSVQDLTTKIVTTTDNTTYTTPAAADTYLVNFTSRKASGGDEEITLTADNASANLVTSWTNTPEVDGWYRSTIVTAFTEAFILAANTNFTAGDVIVNGGLYYIYNSTVDSADTLALDPTKWDALTAINAVGASNQVFVDIFVSQETAECLEAEQIRLGRELLFYPYCKVNKETENKIQTWLQGSLLLYAIPDQAGAQKMIEKAIDLCNC